MDHVITCVTCVRCSPETIQTVVSPAQSEPERVTLCQPDKMNDARVVAENTTSTSSNMLPKRSVSEGAKGGMFLRLLLSVSGLPREEDYSSLSDTERADVDRRVRNNIVTKALKAELTRLGRRKATRQHRSCPPTATQLAAFTIREYEEAPLVPSPSLSLPANLKVGKEEVDGVATYDTRHGWKGAGETGDGPSNRGAEEVADTPAETPSAPGITPPLQTLQTKQSVQRVDSTASSWSTDSGYTSDRGVWLGNGVLGSGALGDLAEGDESTGLILDPGQSQGDPHVGSLEVQLSEEELHMASNDEEVRYLRELKCRYHAKFSRNIEFQEFMKTFNRPPTMIDFCAFQLMFNSDCCDSSVAVPGVGSVEVQLSEEELHMATNDKEVHHLRELKCRYHTEFSSNTEFQELMKTFDRPPTISDYLAFKLKLISDRYDADSDDSGTETPPTNPTPLAGPVPVATLLDELADHNSKSLGHSLMKTLPFALMVALQNLT